MRRKQPGYGVKHLETESRSHVLCETLMTSASSNYAAECRRLIFIPRGGLPNSRSSPLDVIRISRIEHQPSRPFDSGSASTFKQKKICRMQAAGTSWVLFHRSFSDNSQFPKLDISQKGARLVPDFWTYPHSTKGVWSRVLGLDLFDFLRIQTVNRFQSSENCASKTCCGVRDPYSFGFCRNPMCHSIAVSETSSLAPFSARLWSFTAAVCFNLGPHKRVNGRSGCQQNVQIQVVAFDVHEPTPMCDST